MWCGRQSPGVEVGQNPGSSSVQEHVDQHPEKTKIQMRFFPEIPFA